MKNWSTDTAKFRDDETKKIWELVEKMNYGFDGEKADGKEIRRYWNRIYPHLAPEVRRLWELWLWNRVYSLVNNASYWNA